MTQIVCLKSYKDRLVELGKKSVELSNVDKDETDIKIWNVSFISNRRIVFKLTMNGIEQAITAIWAVQHGFRPAKSLVILIWAFSFGIAHVV